MIIPFNKRLSKNEEEHLIAICNEFKVEIQPIVGAHRTIYAMLGDERDALLIKKVEGLPFVERIDRIESIYKLMAIDSDLKNHKIIIGDKELGKDFMCIAGQCTIDPNNKNYFLETSQGVKESGADVIRGGVWKPRTSPHSFQGSLKSLDILIEAKELTGLPVDTEVMNTEQVKLCVDAGVDMLQVGARNALNYELLKSIGEAIAGTKTIVLLKRSIHIGKIDEFLSAAEYIAAMGNPNILLCPRGTLPTVDGFRNHPDESITLLLKQKTWAPVVVDPSHSVGKAIYVPRACLAAAAYGADGICVETHINPEKGIGDDPKQSITPEILKKVISDCRSIYKVQKNY
ncbi:MAG: 3-deoxy-D-arabino-heptulosonate 7-phosphate synthase [Planctomycetota bacterium]|nr:MAG: 3-deoxy-D-arabino-heptulosonate 7-phosphate synthase [Planctomycetota bacterium]